MPATTEKLPPAHCAALFLIACILMFSAVLCFNTTTTASTSPTRRLILA